MPKSKDVHLPHPFCDTTICGDSDDGVMLDDVPMMASGEQVVTCRSCLAIIKACVNYQNKRAAKPKAQEVPHA